MLNTINVTFPNTVSSTAAATAVQVATTVTSTNATYYPTFVSSSSTGNQGIGMATGFTFNPSTGILTSTGYAGTLQTAAQPNITSVGTLTSLTVSGNVGIGGVAATFPLYVRAVSGQNLYVRDLSTGVQIGAFNNSFADIPFTLSGSTITMSPGQSTVATFSSAGLAMNSLAISGVTTLVTSSTATFGGATLTGTGIEVQGASRYQGIFRTDSTHRMYIGHDGSSGAIGSLDNQPWNLYANNLVVGAVTSTGLNSCAIGATTASTGAFTTLSASGATQFSGNAISSPGAGIGSIGGNSTNGLELDGNGGTNDVTILNKNRSTVMSVATGTVNASFAGTIATQDPTNGSGLWMLGKVRTGVALTVSTTTVLEVKVDGTRYDLAVITSPI